MDAVSYSQSSSFATEKRHSSLSMVTDGLIQSNQPKQQPSASYSQSVVESKQNEELGHHRRKSSAAQSQGSISQLSDDSIVAIGQSKQTKK